MLIFVYFIYYILIFISGLFVGSFLNLAADRYVTGEPILIGRSKCDSCKKNLSPKDLIPLFSFVVSKGKCRFCQSKLSFYYPLSEVLTGLVFIGTAYYLNIFNQYSTGKLLTLAFLLTVFSVYLVILFSDIKYKIIPDAAIFFGIAFALLFFISDFVFSFWRVYKELANDNFGKYLIKTGYLKSLFFYNAKSFAILLVSSLIISLFFWLLVFFTKGKGMGEGDIKLGFLIGLFNGFPNNIIAIFLGFLFGAVFSLILVILKKKTMKDTIPFGPFLIIGSVASLIWGSQLINWYFKLF